MDIQTLGAAIVIARRGMIVTGVAQVDLTIYADEWNDANPPKVTLAVEGVTADNAIAVGVGGKITAAQYKAIADAHLLCSGQEDGAIEITCFGTKPVIDVPIHVFIYGAGAASEMIYEAGDASPEYDLNPILDSGTSSKEDDNNPVVNGGGA